MQPLKCPAYVQNGTELHALLSQDVSILTRRKQTKLEIATRADTKKEMAQPRMALSARIAELNLNCARIPEQPSASMSGKVDKVIPSSRKSQPEKAQIAVDIPEKHRYRNLRIENELTDEHGRDVKLKKGAQVEITVTSKAASPRK
jgi:hypothetical protein